MASQEVLLAFVQAATQGSFSAAARKLGRSQSTISAAVASLEIDLDLVLFDRSSRKPTLTPAGHVMLQRAEAILTANSRLEMTARQLSQGVEPKLTVAISDTYQSARFEAALFGFEQRYPDLELECLIAECDDLIELVQRGRAHLAFAEMQDNYPPDLVTSTVAERTDIALFVSRATCAGDTGKRRSADPGAASRVASGDDRQSLRQSRQGPGVVGAELSDADGNGRNGFRLGAVAALAGGAFRQWHAGGADSARLAETGVCRCLVVAAISAGAGGELVAEQDAGIDQKIAACRSSYSCNPCRSCRRLRSFDLVVD